MHLAGSADGWDNNLSKAGVVSNLSKKFGSLGVSFVDENSEIPQALVVKGIQDAVGP
ncbi:MAG: hypothetical protein WBX25_22385 [Rhodomicrobium sp.]